MFRDSPLEFKLFALIGVIGVVLAVGLLIAMMLGSGHQWSTAAVPANESQVPAGVASK